MHPPDCWQRRTLRQKLADDALTPLGWLYGAAVAMKAWRARPRRAQMPVICVGNLSAGGTGKTPVAITLAGMLEEMDRRPFFLTRGYGGKLPGPIRVVPEHRAVDVGDEPLLLAAAAPTIVARRRDQGALLAGALGAGALIMDDGHQNFTLHKDLSVVVVDAAVGFGNGRVLPAGPLREGVRQGLRRADAVVLVGEGAVDLRGFAGPVLRAHVRPVEIPALRGVAVVAFAGIGRPEKFFASLAACGADIVMTRAFPDHHVYSSAELAYLQAAARARGALIVTTAKDYVRMTEIERAGMLFLPVEAAFEDPAALQRLLLGLWPEARV